MTGVVQTMIREHAPGQEAHGADTFKVLQVGTKTIQLTKDSLSTMPDGTTVSVTTAPAADGATRVLSARTVLVAPTAAAVAATTPGNHQLYVAVVQPLGIPADPSISAVSAAGAVTQASAFWTSQTSGKVSFGTAVVMPLYQSAFACDGTSDSTLRMWNEALTKFPAAKGPGKSLVLIAPTGAQTQRCPLGLASVGMYPGAGQYLAFVSGQDPTVLTHELGHNLGLAHSNSARCPGTQDVPTAGGVGCLVKEYDDPFDVMGNWGLGGRDGNLNAAHLDAMNLLPNAVHKIALTPGVTTARLTPLSGPLTTGTTDRALKMTDPNGNSYFVEYRTNSGRDALTGRKGRIDPTWGVRVLRDGPLENGVRVPGSFVLDASPSTSTSDYNRALPVSGVFTVISGNLAIKVIAADAAGATVAVAVSPVPARTSLSIPPRKYMGTVITASTRVTSQYGWVMGGQKVTLQKRQTGTSTWKYVASGKTAWNGAASYRFANGVSGSYRWVTAAASGAPSKVSGYLKVSSTARVVQKRPATRMARGASLKMYGWISPIRSAVVYIQVRSPGGAWHSVARATVKGRVVSGKIKLRKSAFTRFYLKSTTSYRGSFSRVYATLVR